MYVLVFMGENFYFIEKDFLGGIFLKGVRYLKIGWLKFF